jgi:hypothetical protein
MAETKKVLIIECSHENDPGSEGHFLEHMFNIMQVKSKYVQANSHSEILNALGESKEDIIHISTHGSVKKTGNGEKIFKGLWTPTGQLKTNHLALIQGKLKGKDLVVTACNAFDASFAESFIYITLCENFVAPKRAVSFTGSIFFSHIIYQKLLVQKAASLAEVVKQYDERYRNQYEFGCFNMRKIEAAKRRELQKYFEDQMP